MKEKEENILLAAIDLFSEKGFAATTTSEIAKKAGVSEGTIFRYFSTKKDILFALPHYVSKLELSTRLLERIGNIQDLTLEHFLRTLIQNRNAFAANHIKMLRVLLQESTYHPELISMMKETVFAPVKHKIREAVEQFKARGELPDWPSGIIVSLLVSAVLGHMFVRHFLKLDLGWDQADETEPLVQFIKNGFCAKGE
jgi:AcrR family transcriptional regulator